MDTIHVPGREETINLPSDRAGGRGGLRVADGRQEHVAGSQTNLTNLDYRSAATEKGRYLVRTWSSYVCVCKQER